MMFEDTVADAEFVKIIILKKIDIFRTGALSYSTQHCFWMPEANSHSSASPPAERSIISLT